MWLLSIKNTDYKKTDYKKTKKESTKLEIFFVKFQAPFPQKIIN